MPSPIPPALTTPFASPTAAGSRRGWRSSIAALAAPSARPVASPCSPRATNSHTTESASMKRTLVTIRRAERDEQHRPAPDLVGQRGRRGAGSSSTPNA